MSRLHILTGGGNNTYNVVVHSPTPAGNNSAGVPWSDALKNSGGAATNMPFGNGPGQITNTEANNVTSGTVFETGFLWQDNPAWTNQERQNDLTIRAAQAVQAAQDDFQTRLKFFGREVA